MEQLRVGDQANVDFIKFKNVNHNLFPNDIPLSLHIIINNDQDYYKIQQNIWKCIWMRFGNRVIIGGQRKPILPGSDDYDTVD
jgi:hypothetical protein